MGGGRTRVGEGRVGARALGLACLVALLVGAPARADTRAAWADAARTFERAMKAPQGNERAGLFRAAAAQYKALLLADPRRDEAADAALAGSLAFRQVGEWDEAIAMLRPLVDEYGAEAVLARLDKGDPKAVPPSPPDPRRYAERVKHVGVAYRQLASGYVLGFDYAHAVEIFDAWARRTRLEPASRRDAARNAVVLHAAMGEREAALAAQRIFVALAPPPREMLEVELLVVELDAARWDRRTAPDRDAESARRAAIVGFTALHDKARGLRVGTDIAARAAARAAGLSRDHGDARETAAWCERARSAFAASRVAAPPGLGPAAPADLDRDGAGERPRVSAPAWMAPCESPRREPPLGRYVSPAVDALLLPPPRVTE